MDVLLLGLIGAMVLGVAIFVARQSRKGHRPGSSYASRTQNSHVHFSATDSVPPSGESPVYLPHNAESSVEHGTHATHESHGHHSPLDSLVEAAGISLPDTASTDSSSSFSSSFDSGSSFSSGDSGSSASFSSD